MKKRFKHSLIRVDQWKTVEKLREQVKERACNITADLVNWAKRYAKSMNSAAVFDKSSNSTRIEVSL